MKAKFFSLLLLSFLLSFHSVINAQTRKKTTTHSTVQKSSPALVGKTYTGKVYIQPYEGVMDCYVSIYFKSAKEMYMTISPKVVGPDEVQALTEGILAIQGQEPSTVQPQSYTYKNGLVRTPSTDRFRVKNNGKELYYYAEGHEKEVHGNLYLFK